MRRESNLSYILGISASLLAHLLLAVIAVIVLETGAAEAVKMPEVFTVTLEGGESLGGISQVPKDGKEHKKPPPETAPLDQAQPEEAAEVKTTAEEKSIETPTVVEDQEKIIAAKKLEEQKKKKELEAKKELERKKKKEEEKKKAEEKKRAEEAKRKAAEDAKKKAEEKKKQDALKKKKEREERNRRLAEISNQLKSRYEGESANAGGSGFGAARIGGAGMGGGTLASVEKIAYANELQAHVKAGWRWLASTARLRALVLVRILPTGQVQDVRIEQSSGNANFDDSVIRAVRKADPVPPPPAKFYDDFSVVRFWFDSHEQ